ncbi:hypothetical protein E8E11_005566 [Didymella keratinophila]|nr:hypothetical protein E8E11_005566 [Didymella keratinophila]
MSQIPLIKVFGEHNVSSASPVEAAVSGHFPKYTELDEAMFAHFGHLRDGFSLHFHLASHDRCEVELKPKLWDTGAYFLSKLLDDGALHVVPPFTTKHQQTQIPQKRAAAQLEPTGRPHSALQPLHDTAIDAQTCMAKDCSATRF